MKFTTVFAVLATLATAVSATFSGVSHRETNAKRLAAGLGPLAPHRRHTGQGTPTTTGKKNKPSGVHNSCNGGSVQCCNSVSHVNSANKNIIESITGFAVAAGVPVGLTCSPLLGGSSCSSQTVCCENNNVNQGGGVGAVAVGCSPINI